MNKTQQDWNDDFMAAVVRGNIEEAIVALQGGAKLHTLTAVGNNALYVSASRGHEEMFQWLLDVTQDDKPLDINNKENHGDPLLFQLVREGNRLFFIEALLKAGANPDLANGSGMNPLLQACADSKVEEAEILLKYKANPNYRIESTMSTPFMLSATLGNSELCKLLIENGADKDCVDSQGKNALINAIFRSKSFMKKSEKKDHLEMCEYLINCGIDLNYEAPSGLSALGAASYNKNKEVMNLLLEKDVNVNTWFQAGLQGMTTPLHLWSMYKDLPIMWRLMEKGAKLGVVAENGNTPESYAFASGDMNLQSLLLNIVEEVPPEHRNVLIEATKNLDVNSVLIETEKTQEKIIKHVFPILSLAILNGNDSLPIVKELIARGVDVNPQLPETKKHNPLLDSILSNSNLLVKELLNTGKFDLNELYKTDPKLPGMTMLARWANEIDYLSQSKLELKKMNKALQNSVDAANPHHEEFKEVKENKEEEEIKGNDNKAKKEIFNLLLKAGAQLNKINNEGKNEVFYANTERTIKILKEAGSDFFIQDNTGRNALVYAVLNSYEILSTLKNIYQEKNDSTIKSIYYQLAFEPSNNAYAIKKLLNGVVAYSENQDLQNIFSGKSKEKKVLTPIANIDYHDKDGNTALIVACANNNAPLVAMYLAAGADINWANDLGETPLMHALGCKNSTLAKDLIEKGASVTSETLSGKSILDLAEEFNNSYLTDLIKKKIEEDSSPSKKLKVS